MEPFKLDRNESLYLDLVRGVSAQIVVIGHGLSLFSVATFLHEPNVPWMQNIAVLLFFILSGFVITYTVSLKSSLNDQYSFKEYSIDRFSRIYIAFIPAIIFVFAIDFVSNILGNYAHKPAFNIETFVANIFMLQDYPVFYLMNAECCTSFGSARPFWTVAIEWWIYLCFGFLVMRVFKSKKMNFKELITLGFFSIVPLGNIIAGQGNGLSVYWIFGMIGCALYPSYKRLDIPHYLKIILLLLLLACAAIRVAITGMDAYEPIFVFLLAFCLVISLDIFSKANFKPRIEAAIRYNASFSYSLYLIHYSILDFLRSNYYSESNKYFLFVFGFIFSNIVALIFGRFFEIRLTSTIKKKLKKQFIRY